MRNDPDSIGIESGSFIALIRSALNSCDWERHVYVHVCVWGQTTKEVDPQYIKETNRAKVNIILTEQYLLCKTLCFLSHTSSTCTRTHTHTHKHTHTHTHTDRRIFVSVAVGNTKKRTKVYRSNEEDRCLPLWKNEEFTL